MKEFRQRPAASERENLRATTRDAFSKTRGDWVREQREVTNTIGSQIFKDLYRQRYGKEPPNFLESPRHVESPLTESKDYATTLREVIKSMLDKRQSEVDNIHQKYQEFQQKLQHTPIRSLESIKNGYERRYLPYDPKWESDNIRGITFIIDIREKVQDPWEGFLKEGGADRVYSSRLNIQEERFAFHDVWGRKDQNIGPQEPPALYPSNILLYHIEKDLNLVSAKERNDFRLKEIQFPFVLSEEMIDVCRDLIPASGKPFTLSSADVGSVAFEKLMVSPFGKIVSWALKDGQTLLKCEQCHAITITPSREGMGPLWKLERETGEHTGKPGMLASIAYHLQ
jgi:hypothetical protein